MPSPAHRFDGALSPKRSRPTRSHSLGSEGETLIYPNYQQHSSLMIPPLQTIESQEVLEFRDDSPIPTGNTSLETPPEIANHKEPTRPPDSIVNNITCGIINAVIVVPVLMSFASIIYRHAFFEAYMPVLMRLVVVSGIVHQVCVGCLSSLPFCVAQVQDCGLIFLSSMAVYMVDYCQGRGESEQVILATVTVVLSLGTAVLGCGLMLIGKCRLAQLVQLLPTPVVAGYLAFIGWFCGVSGVRMMAGTSQLSVDVLMTQLRFILPGVMGGVLIYTCVRCLKHVAVLPVAILSLLLSFHVGLFITGTSVAEATEDGWIRAMDPAPPLQHTWDFLRLDKVVWSVIPGVLITEVGMICVVALSSSLDVAAIELEVRRPLDYNRELGTIGISNLVSGLTGG